MEAHPEVISSLGLMGKISATNRSSKKLAKVHAISQPSWESIRQALFGLRANNSLVTSMFKYTYNVPGLWQGGFFKRIKV